MAEIALSGGGGCRIVRGSCDPHTSLQHRCAMFTERAVHCCFDVYVMSVLNC